MYQSLSLLNPPKERQKIDKSLTDDIGVDSVEIIDVVRLGASTNKLHL